MSRTAPVTVVLPAFNAAPFLATALESLRTQTTVPEDIVVVDDGSTDDTVAVAQQFGARVLRQAQAGPGAARNRGIEAATTEFVAFLDADDWYVPDKLERCIQHLTDLDASVVGTDAWIVNGDRVERRKNDRRIVATVITLEEMLRGNPIICSTVVARRKSLSAAGGFDEDPELIATEDYDLWLRMAQREPLSYLALPMTFYRTHPGGLSSNQRFLKGVDRILDKVAKVYKGEAHFEKLVLRRRADVRLDMAWDLVTEGRHRDACELVREARRMVPSWKGLKLQLRCMMRW